MRECVINGTLAAAAEIVIWLNDVATYPQLRRVEGRIPADFLHFCASAAAECFVNQDQNREFPLYAAGCIEIGDAKAHSVRIVSAPGCNYMLRIVCR